MFIIIGIVIVFGAVIGGFLMEHGRLQVLMQPAELLIIGGAAIGTLLIANPLPILMQIVKGMTGVLGGSPYSKGFYLQTLQLLNAVFAAARKGGLMQLEADVEDPFKSQVFSRFPQFLKDHHAVHFFCDTLRMAIAGGVAPLDLDQLMELDMEVHHQETGAPVNALQTVADSLPGLGIVAAVLGVIVTMGALGGPPEEIGHKVAAALVGTFLGILLCYGLVGPLAAQMTKRNEEQSAYYNVLRTGLIAYLKGSAPLVAAEFARRVIPSSSRPSFSEMEKSCKGGAAAAGA